MRARRTAATTTALIATLALAGCQKPTPPATFYSSGTAITARASEWCFEGVEAEDPCRQDDVPVARLPVRNGQFAVNVDSKVAERGWYLSVGGEQQQAALFEEYYTYRGIGGLPAEGLPVELVVTDGPEGQDRVTGRYELLLVPE